MLANKRLWTQGSLSFWSWNDKLDRPEIVRQLREFRQVGLHGVFLHARGGLQTPYLGDQWMDAVGWTVEEAKQLGMEIWLYDEDAWPSGFCGGAVPEEGEAYQQKWLCRELVDADAGALQITDRTLACYERVGSSGDWQLLVPEAWAEATGQVLHVYYDVNAYYTDLLNPEAVARFIKHTHEQYKARFAHEFGTTIRGVFTDEPQYAVGQWPWSPALAEAFAAAHGYSLLSILPRLWLEGSGSAKARHDYWQTVTRQFVSSFTAQIGRWCDSNNLCFTGHMAAEDTLAFQLSQVGAAMPHYEWMHMPGIDHLGLRLTRPLLIKQAVSVARQFGKRQVLVETFGCSGWSASFADWKWIADWQLALGVNAQCQHLAAYSLRGARKRDYPPSLSPHQPWWTHFELFNRYIENRQSALTEGAATATLLVLHPITSAWCVYDPGQLHPVRELDRRLGDISQLLLDMQLAFDYGDEMLLEQYGKVEQGSLTLGEGRYNTVILPALFSLELRSFELLQQFLDEGGTIISAGAFPTHLAGEPSEQLQQWCQKHVVQVMPTFKAFEHALAGIRPSFQLTEATGPVHDILAHHRRTDEEEILFLFNSRREDQCRTLTLSWDGCMDIWQNDTLTGGRVRCNTTFWKGKTRYTFQAGPGDSFLFNFTAKKEVSSKTVDETAARLDSMNRDWRLHSQELGGFWWLAEPTLNMLALDRCRYRIAGDTAWSLPHDILHVQDILAARRERVTVELEFVFHVHPEYRLKHELCLAGEDMEFSHISVNGHCLTGETVGAWLDASIQKVLIGSYIEAGLNTIVVQRVFEGHVEHAYLDDSGAFETERNRFVHRTELESLYVLGHFETVAVAGSEPNIETDPGVKAAAFPLGLIRELADRFEIRNQRTHYRIEELTGQGFHFFQGTLSLHTEIVTGHSDRRTTLLLHKPASCVVELDVNGATAGAKAWAPYEWELTDLLKPGPNTLTLRLTGTLRNLLGPHHHYLGDPFFVGPSTFKGSKGWEDKLTGFTHPEVTWQEDYSFVPFGTGSTPLLQVWREADR